MLIRWFRISAVIVLVTLASQSVVSQEFTTTELPLDMDEIMLTTARPEIASIQHECPCLPVNLCPQDLMSVSEDLRQIAEAMQCVRGSVRCCGVSSRSFIGMFGDPEPLTTTESTTGELENYTNDPADSREIESTATETTTSMPKEHVRTGKAESLDIPVHVIYGDDSDLESENDAVLTETTNTKLEDTTEILISTTVTSPTTISTTPPSQTTKKPITVSKSVYKYGDSKKRRRFRPSSIQRHTRKPDIIAELDEVSETIPSEMVSVRMSRKTEPTTVKPRAPVKQLRQRLFNAEKRLNYLLKKQALIQEMSEDTTEVTTTEIPNKVPNPLPNQRLVSHVDTQHKFMIEHVRFMLSQDTRRFPIVPIQSSFSSMAVATTMPKPSVELEIESEPVPVITSTETPITTTTERPFRGRKRYRFAAARTRDITTTSTSTTEKTIEPSETKYRRRQQRLTTVRPNENNDLNEDLLNTPTRYKYQRHTRHTNDSEIEFPNISDDAFSSWAEMFPLSWAYPSTTTNAPTTEVPVVSTTNATTFFRSWTNFLPKPFWGSSVKDQTAEETTTTETINETPTLLTLDHNQKATPFWTSTADNSNDANQRNGRIIGAHVESSIIEGIGASNRDDAIGADEPNFSGIITLNQNLEPWQIIGPIPKFHPPNDAEHIEFELPVDTREVVLM